MKETIGLMAIDEKKLSVETMIATALKCKAAEMAFQLAESGMHEETTSMDADALGEHITAVCKSVDWDAIAGECANIAMTRLEEAMGNSFDGNKLYRIPCTWTMYGIATKRAKSLEDAIEELKNDDPLPDGSYLDESFDVGSADEILLYNKSLSKEDIEYLGGMDDD